jgi:diacylglycerol O-acyltransferase / trehalose O-mycolyltransferase
VSLTLGGGGASAEAMWGPIGAPLWIAHDPSKNVTKLKGVGVYAAAAGGDAGVVEHHHRSGAGSSLGPVRGVRAASAVGVDR